MAISNTTKLFYFQIFIHLFFSAKTYTQTINGDTLTTFELKETAFDGSMGKKNLMDSTAQLTVLHHNLGQFLSQQTPLHIRSYGTGGSATVSFRGTGAAHTQVLWENIPLNSPVHGLADLSLLPITFFENISVQHGTASLQQQSGALGGSIQLKDKIKWNNQLNIKILKSINSLQNYQSNAQINIGQQHWQSVTNWSSAWQKNQWADVFPQEKNAHHLLQELYWKPKSSQIFSTKVWYQTTERKLKATEQQSDQSLRTVFTWENKQQKAHFSAKIAYTNEFLRYQNSLIGVDDSTRLHQFFTQLNQRNFFLDKKIQWHNQVHFTLIKANVTNYENAVNQRKITATSSIYLSLLKNLKTQLLLRQEWIDEQATPFLPALYLHYRPFASGFLQLKASTAKNYHIPTFNDRFWPQVGNPNLAEEYGWAHEFSLIFVPIFRKRKWSLKAEITAYQSRTTDWIQWLPNANNLWSPQNLRLVTGRGVETQLKFEGQSVKTHWRVLANYAFTKSTNEKAIRQGDNSAGKQLVFVPLHTATISFYIIRKNNFIHFSQNYTSKRYKTTDNNPFATLSPYTLADIHLGKYFPLKNTTTKIQFSIYNLWNTDYQTVTTYKMPKRHYELNISFHLNNNKNKSK